jgi:tryptophan 2,3-dioxygenase
MKWDASGRREDGAELTYSEYINVPAVLRAARLPVEVPRGRTREEWPARPEVHDATAEGGKRPWREGEPWPAEWPHDEHLFIVTHQTFELWFKQILLDLDDVMGRAEAIARSHGAEIPPADLAARDPADAPPLRRALAQYPRTRALVEGPLGANEWEKRWAQELREPGAFPARGAPLLGALELGWFDGATLALFARRVARAARILKHATGAFDVLATMPPEEFLHFRSRLNPASGFGSTQFRELEILLGLKDAHRARLVGTGELSFRRHMPADEVARMESRVARPSLRDLVYALLDARDVRGDEAAAAARADRVMAANLAVLHDDQATARAQWGAATDIEGWLHSRWRTVDEILTHAECVQLAEFFARGTTPPALYDLLERCLELDDALRAWRQTHIPLVERIIGARPGTGGGGIAYLGTTLRATRAFPCLWEFRSILTPAV